MQKPKIKFKISMKRVCKLVKKDKEIMNLLKTSKGQLEGIIKMVEDDRYCVDISKQILAVQALLRKINLKILEKHKKTASPGFC